MRHDSGTSPIELSLFVSRLEAVCAEMGLVLRRTAFSPNIKDRLDFSCALFDAAGGLCAQAAHIPVHLGSMAYAMRDIVQRFDWCAGDVVILNDPFMGGTHLPDVTLVAPVFHEGQLLGFAVNRAHHASIGSDTPGSMPLATTLAEEGLLISPCLLVRAGKLDVPLCRELMQALRPGAPCSDELSGDLAAQHSAVQVGVARMSALLARMGLAAFTQALRDLDAYGDALTEAALRELPEGTWTFRDVMDDDGHGNVDVPIVLTLRATGGCLHADFSGSAPQVHGNINCPLAVTAAAVYYVLRCLLPDHAPACAGLFRRVSISAPEGSLLNARAPAAVAAGNVETSSRVVDVMLGALQQALPGRIPAASQGTMNNVALGWHGADVHWDYYETIAGGMGAGPSGPGMSAVHTHMTNTLNTPVESLELHYPLRVLRYALRRHSGGAGLYAGGDGVVREYEFLGPAQVSLLTERRTQRPWGSSGGQAAQAGCNHFNGQVLPGKTMLRAGRGDRLCIETPGGGGWGE